MTEQVEQKTRTNTALKYPPRYDVIIFNDDFTPVEFVIKPVSYTHLTLPTICSV